jgi:hypothetical protein
MILFFVGLAVGFVIGFVAGFAVVMSGLKCWPDQ